MARTADSARVAAAGSVADDGNASSSSPSTNVPAVRSATARVGAVTSRICASRRTAAKDSPANRARVRPLHPTKADSSQSDSLIYLPPLRGPDQRAELPAAGPPQARA